jgi:hypothetical protein
MDSSVAVLHDTHTVSLLVGRTVPLTGPQVNVTLGAWVSMESPA